MDQDMRQALFEVILGRLFLRRELNYWRYPHMRKETTQKSTWKHTIPRAGNTVGTEAKVTGRHGHF